MKPSDIKFLILHTSDSPWGSVSAIRSWHKARGWDDIGYHFVITNPFLTSRAFQAGKPDASADGKVWTGRAANRVGSHCQGYNDRSLGICLVGKGGNYTEAQLAAATKLCLQLMTGYKIPVQNVLGHRETPRTQKTCPDMDMNAWRARLLAAQANDNESSK